MWWLPPGLIGLIQVSLNPKLFASQNDMFKEIQDIFSKPEGNVHFCGEYSFPEEALGALNGEAALMRKQSDRTIIHSHSERVWRMMGLRWKCVLLPFK